MKSYTLGGQLIFATTFIDPTTGDPTDPTAVTLELLDPAGTVHTVATSHPGVGLFKALYTPTISGVWTCRWEGTGAVVAASEYRFEVRPSAFAS